MPDFTVIDGDGDCERAYRERAQRFFEAFIVALLRDLASERYTPDCTGPFFEFVNYAVDHKVFGIEVLEAAIREVGSRAFDSPNRNRFDLEEKAITAA